MNIKYFDNSATTKTDEDVIKTMLPYFNKLYGNPSSLYTLGKISKEMINSSKNVIAKILKCKPSEIYFTSGGTESDNLAIKGIAIANKRKGNHIITTRIEHPAVLNTCSYLEKIGFKVTYLNVDENGRINLDELKRAINYNTILISIMAVNNEIGTIQDLEPIGEIAQKNKVYFHSDCVQAIGNIKIDVKKMNLDSISLSGHKFYGPKGIGILYIKEGIDFFRLQDGGHQENDKRAGTENVPGIIGISRALELSEINFKNIVYKNKLLSEYLINEIKNNIPYSRLNGGNENRANSICNFSFKGVNGRELVEELDKANICVSNGSACSAGIVPVSEVLKAIKVPYEYLNGSIRISLGKNNNKEEVDYLLYNLIECIKKLREKNRA